MEKVPLEGGGSNPNFLLEPTEQTKEKERNPEPEQKSTEK